MSGTPKAKPPGLRRRAREATLALLYQLDMGVPDFSAHKEHYFETNKMPKKARIYAVQLIEGVMGKRKEIDDELTRVSNHWRIDRMNVIDRNIIRLAIYEILHMDDVPRNVSINEAIEIGKLYGTEDSGSFINGILDRFQKPQEPVANDQAATD
jgi:N utilization substance protein B